MAANTFLYCLWLRPESKDSARLTSVIHGLAETHGTPKVMSWKELAQLSMRAVRRAHHVGCCHVGAIGGGGGGELSLREGGDDGLVDGGVGLDGKEQQVSDVKLSIGSRARLVRSAGAMHAR